MNVLNKFLCALVGTSLLLPATASAAGGAVIAPERLAAEDRDALRQQIDVARAHDPQVFEDLARLRTDLPSLDQRRRGRLAPITLMLKPMGDRALMPMLERLAFADAERGELTDTAWRAWQAGLIEAVGIRRDERAAPVLRAILDGPAADPLVMTETVEAFAKLDSEAIAAELVARSLRDGPWHEALLAGMGYCRRLAVAQRLAEVMDSQPPVPTAQAVARSLGNLGAGGSWQLLGPEQRSNEVEIRGLAARTLIVAHLHYTGEVQRMATKALLVVDLDATPAIIADARRGADSAQLASLDRLLSRFENSMLRRRR